MHVIYREDVPVQEQSFELTEFNLLISSKLIRYALRDNAGSTGTTLVVIFVASLIETILWGSLRFIFLK